MQIHDIKPAHRPQQRQRVGRGGKHGTYAGRGMKGQRSRAGTRKYQPWIRRWIKRYPKLRGYRFSPVSQSPVTVNLHEIAAAFEDNEEVTPETLVDRGVIRRKHGCVPPVKILGSGKPEKAVVVQGCQYSEAARRKIEEKGGTVRSV